MESASAERTPQLMPEQVRAAREAAGFKRIIHVVQRTGLNFRTVKAYEDKTLAPQEPSLRVITTLATLYKVPITAFFDADPFPRH